MPEGKQKSVTARHNHGYGALVIYETLRDDILSLKLEPGMLIDETSLAKRFKVSRSPIREALVKLGTEGLTKTLPNKGTIVAPLALEELPNYMDALDLIQRAVTRLAAINRTNSDINEIRTKQKQFLKTLGSKNIVNMIQTNADFHLSISKAGQNQFLTEAYKRILNEGRRSLLFYFKTFGEVVPEDLGKPHEKMIIAIEEKDADLAEKLAAEHTNEVHKRFVNFFANRLTQDISVNNENTNHKTYL